jgi:ribonuclease HII
MTRRSLRPRPDLSLESAQASPVCGVDEAGRGPWAGPVCAAAVILDPARLPEGLDDSKRLTAAARERLAGEIRETAIAYAIAFASVAEIAERNIVGATGLAMRRAVDALSPKPAFALIDGNIVFDLCAPALPVVGGDGLSASIAAASILAKTARDQAMIALDAAHPGYGFAVHKGYGVPAHAEALVRLGPCAAHRMSYQALQRRLAQGGGA